MIPINIPEKKSHAGNIKSRLLYFVGIAYSFNALFNITAAMNYYFSYMYFTICYYLSVWGGALEASYGGKKTLFAS